LRPDFLAVDGYDGMAAIYAVIDQLHGDVDDADKVMAAFKGLKIDSPRGPIMIDPDTRDVIQTVYIRKVERQDGKLVNAEFDKVENVKDPGK